jgi:hypothetical protein
MKFPELHWVRFKTLGSVNLTLHDRTYRFQAAPEEIKLTEDGLIGRDILKDSVIHNRERYVDIIGHRYNFGLRNTKPIILKLRTETTAAVTVELDNGLKCGSTRNLPRWVHSQFLVLK